ncbi:MAG: hypothetical protein GKR91_20130 [Pseudomonadales bacterium]|nr:hypothetical protein [Pseudomonadales bacterium]
MDIDTTKVNEKMEELWPQFRRLLLLQVKLYIDAFRDILLSAVSLGAFLIDVVQRNTGPDCYFEQVLKFGRKTERAINLFNQYDPEYQGPNTVDGVINDLEDRFKS